MGLRARAEAAVKRREDGTSGTDDRPTDDQGHLLHELWVHQIELEMQNEELRRAQEELAASRDLYLRLFDFAPVGYLTLTKSNLIREANLTAARLLGLERAQLLGCALTSFVAAADQDRFHFHRRSVLEGQGKKGAEVELERRDGTRFRASLSSVEDEKDAELWRVTLNDVSELRDLEHMLAQAQKIQAIGELAGGIAHEFNNLMTVIGGNAEVIGDLPLMDEETRECVQSVKRAVARGASLTHRLLAFSRKQPLSPDAVDISAAVDGMGDMVRRVLGEGCEVSILPGTDIWPVMIDAHQLEASLLNLVINARHAMADGGALVIECENVTLSADQTRHLEDVKPGDYVKATVRDDGAGMAPKTLARALEPFFTTKSVGAGTGLGLSMVYGFVKQSRGHIEIESEQGLGTTVMLYLPRSAEAATPFVQ